MSVYHDIYLEGLVDGVWTALGPWFKADDGTFNIAPVMSGQSGLGMMVSDLGCWYGAPADISADVLSRAVYVDGSGEECKLTCRWFELSDLGDIDPSRYEHEGYAPCGEVSAFERGDAEDIWDWLSPREYGALPADEKQAYTYYRWSEPCGVYDLKCELKRRCVAVADMRSDCWCWLEAGEVKGMGGGPSALRCIVVSG